MAGVEMTRLITPLKHSFTLKILSFIYCTSRIGELASDYVMIVIDTTSGDSQTDWRTKRDKRLPVGQTLFPDRNASKMD